MQSLLIWQAKKRRRLRGSREEACENPVSAMAFHLLRSQNAFVYKGFSVMFQIKQGSQGVHAPAAEPMH